MTTQAEIIRERARVFSRKKVSESQNIGPPPECVNPERREACRLNFPLALETYFRRPDWRPWSPQHLESFEIAQRVTLEGGLSCKAHPRGFAKTTIAEFLAIWSIINAHHEFVCFLGKNATSAEQALLSIKTEIETN